MELVLNHVSARIAPKAYRTATEAEIHEAIAVVACQSTPISGHPYEAPAVLIDVVNEVMRQSCMHIKNGEIALSVKLMCSSICYKHCK